MRTRLELQTAPNSAIGAMAPLVECWENVAVMIDELVNPAAHELILWDMVYNRHQQTGEEFETEECSPIPIMFGRVALVSHDTLWDIRRYDNVVQFGCLGVSICSNNSILLEVGKEAVVRVIVTFLR